MFNFRQILLFISIEKENYNIWKVILSYLFSFCTHTLKIVTFFLVPTLFKTFKTKYEKLNMQKFENILYNISAVSFKYYEKRKFCSYTTTKEISFSCCWNTWYGEECISIYKSLEHKHF